MKQELKHLFSSIWFLIDELEKQLNEMEGHFSKIETDPPNNVPSLYFLFSNKKRQYRMLWSDFTTAFQRNINSRTKKLKQSHFKRTNFYCVNV